MDRDEILAWVKAERLGLMVHERPGPPTSEAGGQAKEGRAGAGLITQPRVSSPPCGSRAPRRPSSG